MRESFSREMTFKLTLEGLLLLSELLEQAWHRAGAQ